MYGDRLLNSPPQQTRTLTTVTLGRTGTGRQRRGMCLIGEQINIEADKKCGILISDVKKEPAIVCSWRMAALEWFQLARA